MTMEPLLSMGSIHQTRKAHWGWGGGGGGERGWGEEGERNVCIANCTIIILLIHLYRVQLQITPEIVHVHTALQSLSMQPTLARK